MEKNTGYLNKKPSKDKSRTADEGRLFDGGRQQAFNTKSSGRHSEESTGSGTLRTAFADSSRSGKNQNKRTTKPRKKSRDHPKTNQEKNHPDKEDFGRGL